MQFGAFWGLRRAFLTNENPFCQNNVDSAAYLRIGSYAPDINRQDLLTFNPGTVKWWNPVSAKFYNLNDPILLTLLNLFASSFNGRLTCTCSLKWRVFNHLLSSTFRKAICLKMMVKIKKEGEKSVIYSTSIYK